MKAGLSEGSSRRRSAGAVALVVGVLAAAPVASSACTDSFYFDDTRRDGGEGGVAAGDAASADGSSGSFTKCKSDPDCILANLHCDTFFGLCVECVTDSHCPGAHCDAVKHRCVQCESKDDCPRTPRTQICEPTTRTCLLTCGEGAAEVCPGTQYCVENQTLPTLGNYCVQCTMNSDCASQGTKKECDRLTGRCTECDQDEECPAARPRCDRLHDICVECTTSADCPAAKPLCDPSIYSCVAAR